MKLTDLNIDLSFKKKFITTKQCDLELLEKVIQFKKRQKIIIENDDENEVVINIGNEKGIPKDIPTFKHWLKRNCS